MNKDEALKLALEALETNNKAWKRLADSGDAGWWEAEEQPFFEISVKAITAIKETLAQPEQEPVAWEGGEGWESLAWELCADENGEEACNELIWEGGPIPEPWGDRWMKYEDEAKRLIALVHKHKSPLQRKPLTDEELRVIEKKINLNMRWRSSDEEGITLYPSEYYELVRAIEAAHGITGENHE